LCDFVSPAIFRQDHVTIAVGSDAREVKRSIRIRNRIMDLIEKGILQMD
jgi:siroheme synthase (precorrin-2 oxidase/ferrochelatase)